jgi:hypothetical protein
MMDIRQRFVITISMHFPEVKPGDVKSLSCEVCESYKMEYCEGENLKGDEVIECMWNIIREKTQSNQKDMGWNKIIAKH